MMRRTLLGISGAVIGSFAFGQDAGSPIKVTDFGASGDGATSNALPFERAIRAARGKVLLIPAGVYLIERTVNVADPCKLVGENGTKLVLSNAEMAGFVLTGSMIEISNIEIDAAKANKKPGATAVLIKGDKCRIANCVIENSKDFGIRVSGDNASVINCTIRNSDGTGVALIGANKCNIQNVSFSGNKGFGVQVTGGASFNVIQGCSTKDSGLELVGVTYDAHHNSVIKNSAENCGDNGISVTGYMNYVASNLCSKNAYNGIGVWGERNIIVGNSCSENGQKPSATEFAEIGITPGFGGLGRYNLVYKNNCESVSSALHTSSFKLAKAWYLQWQKSIPLSYKQLYYYYNDSIYRLMSVIKPGLVSGDVAPTHTSGIANDGKVDWLWLGSSTSSFDQQGTAWPRKMSDVITAMKGFSAMRTSIVELEGFAEFQAFSAASATDVSAFSAPSGASNQFDARANFLLGNIGSMSPARNLRNASSARNKV